MPLSSDHFKNNQRLQRCLVDDSARVFIKLPPERGPHVSLIQEALFILLNNVNLGDELGREEYGPKTAAALLRYKETHTPPIINPAYQNRVDNIVGKMTIRYLDEDMQKKSGKKPSGPALVVPPAPKLPGRAVPTLDSWSVCGFFGLMAGTGGAAKVPNLAQFGFSLFKFRNDKTGQVRTYVSPMWGVGFSFDMLSLAKWLRGLKNKNLKLVFDLERRVVEVLSKGLNEPHAVLKEIAKAVATGSSVQDWTDFSSCEVYLPLTHSLLDGKTIGNASFTPGAPYQFQKVWLYGQVWYEEESGKKMFGRRDLLSASSSGWALQVPGIGASFVGGPLLIL